MKITADSNVFLRALVADDPAQAKIAQDILARAELVAVPVATLCEVVWVLSQRYKIATTDIAQAIRTVINGANVVVDRIAVEAGLAMLDDGGDFADGAIAAEGSRFGGDVFASFDKQAIRLLEKNGVGVRLLTS